MAEKSEKSRKNSEELMKAIMEALPVRSLASVSGLAEAVGASWGTTRRYLSIMIWLQAQPSIIVTRYGRRELFKREPARRSKKEEGRHE